jgi:hypothetical protein
MSEGNKDTAKMSFFIMMHDNPIKWIGHEDSSPLAEWEFVIWEGLRNGIFKGERKEYAHPCLRYEDVMAHLFMQLMGTPLYVDLPTDPITTGRNPDVLDVIKAGRQYCNQLMKKVCQNCRFYLFEKGEVKNSKDYASLINEEACHKNCNCCRVSNIIQFGTSFHELTYGQDEMQQHMSKAALLWKKRATRWRRKARKLRFVNKKILVAKKLAVSKLVEFTRAPREIHRLDLGVFEKEFLNDPMGSPPTGRDIKRIHKVIEENPNLKHVITTAPMPDRTVAVDEFGPFEEIDKSAEEVIKRYEKVMGEEPVIGTIPKPEDVDKRTQEIVEKMGSAQSIEELAEAGEEAVDFLNDLSVDDLTLPEEKEDKIFGETEEEFMENMDPEMRQDIKDAVEGNADSRFPYLHPLRDDTSTEEEE